MRLTPGMESGKWRVVRFAGRNSRRQILLSCRCICGTEGVITEDNLLRGLSQSCRSCARTRHGMWHSPEYKAYAKAKDRCTNPRCCSYPEYGGRGIRFRFNSFAEWYAELGPRPEGYSVDRINNDGNYEPGNVRWATSGQQQRNKRRRVCA